MKRRVKHDHIENTAEDNSRTGIFGFSASEGSNPFGKKSDIVGVAVIGILFLVVILEETIDALRERIREI